MTVASGRTKTLSSLARILSPAVFGAILAALPVAAAAQDLPAANRYAIVIGNSNYDVAGDLPNAMSDARLFSTFARRLGFQVLEYDDLTKQGFEAMLNETTKRMEPGSDTVFYFAGHGLQVGGSNFLIPVDANLDTPLDLAFEAVSLTDIVDILGKQSRVKLFIIDSCRNNPFGDVTLISGLNSQMGTAEAGFAPLTAPLNSLLAYSTSPGAVAYDGLDGNSPFTEALVKIGAQRAEEQVVTVLSDVRRQVAKATGGLQVPWDSSTLIDDFAFAAPGSPALSETPAIPEPASADTATRSAEKVVTLALDLPFAENVALGQTLLQQIDLGDIQDITLQDQPQQGTLGLSQAQGLRVGLASPNLTPEALGRLVYSPRAQASRSLVMVADPTAIVSDSFTLWAENHLWQVNVTLRPDPCDIQAGDHLDPDGTGIGRYANEIPLREALASCQAAVAAHPDVGRFHYQLGRVHVGMGDLDLAEAAFLKAQELGHTRAWAALAALYNGRSEQTQGRSQEGSSEQALALLQQGADRGDPYAYHSLGFQLFYHGKTPEDRNRGYEYFRKAAELGQTFSLNALGKLFLDEDSEQYNPELGLRYWKESADRGDIYGFANMGVAYRDGLAGLPADPKLALEWFEKAVAGGHPYAPVNIGRMYYDGRLGKSGKITKALEWFDLGLARGDAWGGANAAWIILNDRPEGFSATDAALRAAKAAAMADEKAAKSASETLSSLPDDVLGQAALDLMQDLSPDVPGYSLLDDASRSHAAGLLQETGIDPPQSSAPRDWLVALARAYLVRNPFRVDLN